MNILPRQSWTSKIPRSNIAADRITGIPTFRFPVGINFITPVWNYTFAEQDPVEFFNHELGKALAEGESDIKYNLGVADHVYTLRGLANKSSYSDYHSNNNTIVTVLVLLGKNEKPSDQLLRNIVDARELVLSRYPTCTGVYEYNGNTFLERILSTKEFWCRRNWEVTEPILPQHPLEIGTESCHIFDLQEQLSYWGYYRKRVDGRYGTRTEDALTALKADLYDGGFYQHEDFAGHYDDRIATAWLKYLEA